MEPVTCPHCHRQQPERPGSGWCRYCGAALEQPAPEDPQPETLQVFSAEGSPVAGPAAPVVHPGTRAGPSDRALQQGNRRRALQAAFLLLAVLLAVGLGNLAIYRYGVKHGGSRRGPESVRGWPAPVPGRLPAQPRSATPARRSGG